MELGFWREIKTKKDLPKKTKKPLVRWITIELENLDGKKFYEVERAYYFHHPENGHWRFIDEDLRVNGKVTAWALYDEPKPFKRRNAY